MQKITEQPSRHRDLEHKSIEEITRSINQEDATVAEAIREALPAVNRLIGAIVARMKEGGRLFYVGAGSGGRLSVLDVIELPTTYGVPKGQVIAVLAGGMSRLVEALEEKEDDREDAWEQLRAENVSPGVWAAFTLTGDDRVRTALRKPAARSFTLLPVALLGFAFALYFASRTKRRRKADLR